MPLLAGVGGCFGTHRNLTLQPGHFCKVPEQRTSPSQKALLCPLWQAPCGRPQEHSFSSYASNSCKAHSTACMGSTQILTLAAGRSPANVHLIMATIARKTRIVTPDTLGIVQILFGKKYVYIYKPPLKKWATR